MREQPQWMSMHLQRMGGLADDFYFSQCSQPSTNQQTNNHLTPLTIWKLPTNHHLVVA